MRLDLSRVDVVEFLEAIDIQNITFSGNDVRFSCPFPEHKFGDKNPSGYMNKDNTAFICFSCGRKGNAITFLADVMGVSNTQARYWISQKWSSAFVEIDHFKNYIISLTAEKKEEVVVDNYVLDEKEYSLRKVSWTHEWFRCSWGNYMLGRGFTSKILEKFEVSYDPISDRPCLTIRDEYGNLVGFKGRAWREDQFPKYMIIGDTERSLALYGPRYGFAPYDASKYLFGLDKAKPKDGTLIFCEGELNVISMHQKGFSNVVGPSGSTVSEVQVRKLVKACDQVIVLFDSDRQDQGKQFAARAKVATVVAQLSQHIPVKVVPEHDGDPAEMSADVLKELVDAAESATVTQIKNLIA